MTALTHTHALLPFPPLAQTKRWSALEVDALVEGVTMCGPGSWAAILSRFQSRLPLRNQVDLKDKWRNMSKMGNPACGPAEAAYAASEMARGAAEREDAVRAAAATLNAMPNAAAARAPQPAPTEEQEEAGEEEEEEDDAAAAAQETNEETETEEEEEPAAKKKKGAKSKPRRSGRNKK